MNQSYPPRPPDHDAASRNGAAPGDGPAGASPDVVAAVDAALRRLAEGEAVVDVLAAVEGAATEVAALLGAADALRRAAAPPAAHLSAGRADLERRLRASEPTAAARREDAAWRRLAQPIGPRAQRWPLRLAGALVAVALLLGAADRATANSRPGDALWPVRAALDGGHRAVEAFVAGMRDGFRRDAGSPRDALRHDAPDGEPLRRASDAAAAEGQGDGAAGAAHRHAQGRAAPTATGEVSGGPTGRRATGGVAVAVDATPTVASRRTLPAAAVAAWPTAPAEATVVPSAPPTGPAASTATRSAPSSGATAVPPTATPSPAPTEATSATTMPSPTDVPSPTTTPTASPTAVAVGVCQGVLRGHVTEPRGGPADGALVTAMTRSIVGGPITATATADTDGLYAVVGLCGGDYLVSAAWSGTAGAVWRGIFDVDGDGAPDPVVIDEADPSARERWGIDIVVRPATVAATATVPAPTVTPPAPPTATPTTPAQRPDPPTRATAPIGPTPGPTATPTEALR